VHRAVLVIVSDPNDHRIKTRYRLSYHPMGLGKIR
jgi:hypothetical protein